VEWRRGMTRRREAADPEAAFSCIRLYFNCIFKVIQESVLFQPENLPAACCVAEIGSGRKCRK